MHIGSLGAFELSGRAGARAQQRRIGRGSRCRAAAGRRFAPVNGEAPTDAPLIRHLGLVPYESTWRAMQRFTDERDAATRDEIWFLEHPPVFTLGLNASREHLLAPREIPVVQIDRGGQVTYHGRGQLVVALSNAVIDYVAELGIAASGSRAAPGVYVNGANLASIGLRIRRGASYH